MLPIAAQLVEVGVIYSSSRQCSHLLLRHVYKAMQVVFTLHLCAFAAPAACCFTAQIAAFVQSVRNL